MTKQKKIFRNAASAEQELMLGNKCAQSKNFASAETHFRNALKLRPQFPQSHNNLANILKERGNIEEALTHYREAVAFDPMFAVAHTNIGVLLTQLKKPVEAEQHLRTSLGIDPLSPETSFNLGNALSEQGKYADAVEVYLKAIEMRPAYPDAHLNLGNAYRLLNDLERAAHAYQKTFTLQPNHAGAYHNLGNVLVTLNRIQDAIACFQRAVLNKPNYAEAHLNLGNAYARGRNYKEAVSSYDNCIAHAPEYPEAHLNRSMINLTLGNFADGWCEYEWRLQKREFTEVFRSDVPLWRGEDLTGKTILLCCEQGLGDSIQFIRYTDDMRKRGGVIWVLCPKSLSAVFSTVQGVNQTFNRIEEVPAHDYYVPLMSLPSICGTVIDTIPDTIPYIFADPVRATSWMSRLKALRRLKVGLVWAGDARSHNPLSTAVDTRRSIALKQLEPLANVSSAIEFVSLQKGSPSRQLKDMFLNLHVVDFMDTANDFADTAALIQNLDLVIGVDTSVIHLAGAMGKPVWVLSRFDACWRWLEQRRDSPWYPTMRLFYQDQPGDWLSVIEDVRVELADFAKQAQ